MLSRLSKIALAGLMVLVTWSSQAVAQQKVIVGTEGGVALPASRLAKLTDAGPSFGLKVGYQVHPRIAVNVLGDVDVLNGATLTAARAPDMRLWHYGAGVEAGLLPASAKRWSLNAGIGIGATTFDSDKFVIDPDDDTRSGFSETYFTTTGSVRVGYAVNRRLTTYIGSKAFWMATDREDTAMLAALDPTRAKAFSSAWTFPVTAGLNYKL